jgi:DEAD/DEAH box helicase domain-containing protein
MQELWNLYEDIRQRIELYIDTAYWTNDEEFNCCRREYLRDRINSPIYTDPIYEIIPRYPVSSMPFAELVKNCGLKGLVQSDYQFNLLLDFLNLNQMHLFEHQLNSVEVALLRNENAVVTTGTGSGKSLCFVLPLVLNILKEALGSNGRPLWDGNGMHPDPEWWSDDSEFAFKRSSTNRQPAIRCLIMYPLNALVQDQIETFRRLLNSDEANTFFGQVLNGERIYFGQYNGATLGKGSYVVEEKVNKCRGIIRQMSGEYNDASSDDRHRIQSPYGSELVTRWDMQDFPPDILITNHSMLAIMLVREQEQKMFEQTRAWLSSSQENKFYLVIDELHSYRGTAGSEISYIIKTFLEKIGLNPAHPQLKIVGTSASMEEVSPESDVDPKFLSDFFGTDNTEKHFTIIDGPEVQFETGTINSVSKLKNIFKEYFHSKRHSSDIIETLRQLSQATGINGDEGELLTNLKLEDSLNELIKSKGENTLTLFDIANGLFSGDEIAAKGFISLLTYVGAETKGYKGKIRLHLFVKNLSGIVRSMRCNSGELVAPTLYEKGQSYCPQHHAITLECLYCQDCGELYYRGYRVDEEDSQYITSEPPLLSLGEDEQLFYLRFTTEDGGGGWNPYSFNSITGELQDWEINGVEHIARVLLLETVSKDPPNQCPACGTNWVSRPDRIISPLRAMGTGYDKMHQVIIEQVLANLSPQNTSSRPKLVIFSDSRRDASRVSAELEFNHYRDTVRSTAENILQNPSGITAKVQKFITIAKRNNVDELEVLLTAYARANAQFAPYFFRYIQGTLNSNQYPEEYERARRHVEQASLPLLRFGELAEELETTLKDRGINPIGIRTLRDFSDWPRLYVPPPSGIEENESIRNAKIDVHNILKNELRKTINSSMGKDFESLGFGWLTFDRSHPRAPTGDQEIKLLDSTIRFLSFWYKTRSEFGEGVTVLPGITPGHSHFCDWVRNAFPSIFKPDATKEEVSEKIRDLFSLIPGLVDDFFRINFDHLYIHTAQNSFWVCDVCSSIQLFSPNGYCRRIRWRSLCNGNLNERPIEDLLNSDNYYKAFSEYHRHEVPLRTEELIGHTDKTDQRERQLAFQNIFTGNLKRRGDGSADYLTKYFSIEALSVTTTMEAGVDIGELKSIYLANMPPRRFNYQQRVGRAGRREMDRITVIFTFCKGQKHDEFYFKNPNLMVSETTPPPKLDIENKDIVNRVALKICLNHLFSSDAQLRAAIPPRNIEGSTNAGRLGTLSSFRDSENQITNCLNREQGNLVRRFQSIFVQLNDSEINELINQLKVKILNFINSIDGLIDSLKFTQNWSTSEVLEMEGYFPIYGMPVRNTALIHKNPNHDPNNRNWPIEQGRIDRDSEISISEFAPLQEVIKDKEVIKCVGVGWLFPQGQRRFIRGERYLRNRNVNVCTTCGSILFEDADFCSKCTEGDRSKFFRFESWEPEYYIADFNGVVTYDGQVNSTRQNISEYPDLPNANFIDGPPSTNYKIRSQKGCLVRANTNDFSGYRFNRVSRGPVLPGVYIEQEAVKSIRTVEWHENNGNLDVYENSIALTTEKITDFLLVTLKDWPIPYRSVDPSSELRYCINGAWRSLAEIIGRGITRMEDIEPQEISVGVKPEIFIEQDGTRSWQWAIYIADNLDNGAGYSSKYEDPEELRRLLKYVESNVVNSLLSDTHRKTCLSSCYDCIRHYGNRFYHESLDWRLGVDLLNLLINPESSITRMNSYWGYLLTDVLPIQLEEYSRQEDGNFEISEIDGYTIYCHSTRPFALFSRHPLLDPQSCVDVTHARNNILSRTDDRITQVLSFSIYDFIRNPLRAWQKIQGLLE